MSGSGPIGFGAMGTRGLESAVALAIARSRGISDAGEHVLGAMGGVLGLRAGLLWGFDEERDSLGVAASWVSGGGVESFLEESRCRRFGLNEGLPGMVWAKRQVVWLSDVWSDDRYPRAGAAREAGLRAAIGIPLVARGELVGVAELLSDDIVEVDPELAAVLEGLGGQIGQLLERVRADEAIAASEARKAAVLDASLDAVVTTDGAGVIVEANHAITPLLGWSVEEVVGARVGDLIVLPSCASNTRRACVAIERRGSRVSSVAESRSMHCTETGVGCRSS